MGRYFSDIHASCESQFRGLPHGLADTPEIAACRAEAENYDGFLSLADALCWQLRFREAIDALHAQDPDFCAKAYLRAEMKTCYTGSEIYAERFFPAWLFCRDDDFVRNSYDALCAAGLHPTVTNYSFCTNGSHYAGEKGIRTIGFGPSLESLAHTVDEYVLTEQLSRSADGYAALLEALLVCTGKPQIPAKN